MKRILLILLVLVFGCRNTETKPEQKQAPLIQQESKMASRSEAQFFKNTHDAKSYLRQTMSKTNKFEVELNNMLNRGVSGNVIDVDSMITEATEMLISARYSIETLENIKAYLEGLEGRVSRGNMTSQLTSLEDGWSLGPPCGGGILIITVDGDVELNGHKIQVFDHLIIKGKLLNNGIQLSSNEAIAQGLIELACDNSVLEIHNE